ncbi:MAG TPA: helix-turn-helix domain-containing protein [Stackebrandtia sp.]|jgi:transcriptional regulator with XRE-family HTH domain|nr:helix-turn-helix domain-containing protein [Stackebrandtia sp.]HZE41157.1 helix-turn-helix domain-containing protein [Stackebrandtia sp.]
MAERDIGGFIRDMRRKAKVSLRQLADQAGVSNPYLSQIERGLRKPSAEVLQQLANALKVSTPLMYLRAGLLNQKDGPQTLSAIASDPLLTARQKQTLTEIYEAFRRENARDSGADLDDDDTEPVVTDADVAAAADGDPEDMGIEDSEVDVKSPAPKPERAPQRGGRARARKRTTPSRPKATNDLKENADMTDRKLPKPFYAAAGAGEMAVEQIRKIPGKVEELRDRAKLEEKARNLRETVTENVKSGVDTIKHLDADKVRGIASETASTLGDQARKAGSKARETYTELVERGEHVAAGERSPIKVIATIADRGHEAKDAAKAKVTQVKEDVDAKQAEDKAESVKAAATKTAPKKTTARKTPAKKAAK